MACQDAEELTVNEAVQGEDRHIPVSLLPR
jgi:hypothetical protein